MILKTNITIDAKNTHTNIFTIWNGPPEEQSTVHYFVDINGFGYYRFSFPVEGPILVNILPWTLLERTTSVHRSQNSRCIYVSRFCVVDSRVWSRLYPVLISGHPVTRERCFFFFFSLSRSRPFRYIGWSFDFTDFISILRHKDHTNTIHTKTICPFSY